MQMMIVQKRSRKIIRGLRKQKIANTKTGLGEMKTLMTENVIIDAQQVTIRILNRIELPSEMKIVKFIS